MSRTGYVLKVYPRFSETFIVTEILAREAQGEDRQRVDLLATPREEPQDGGHAEPGRQDHGRKDEGDAELARRAQVRVDPPEAAVAGRGGQRVEDEHLQGRERRDRRDDARDHRTRGEPHPAGPVGQSEGRRRRAGPGGTGGRGGATGGMGHAARLTARLGCGHESLRRRFVNESVCGGSAAPAVSSTTAVGRQRTPAPERVLAQASMASQSRKSP